MKKTKEDKTIWPWGKPLPRFSSETEEIEFWQSHQFEPPPDDAGEELIYEPQPRQQARNHVYRIRLNDQEQELLHKLAKKRGVPASVIIRELIHQHSA